MKAVEGGRVALVQRLSTYGLTVILEHGNGYYSVYSQLATAAVAAGAQRRKGRIDRNGGRGEYGLRARICTSRFGERTRSRWTRLTGCRRRR